MRITREGAGGDVAMWRRYGLLFGWLVVAASWLVIAAIIFLRVPRDGSDFGSFIGAAQALRFDPHADIYLPATLGATVRAHGGCALWGGPTGPHHLYPPLLAILLEPLSALPCTGATYIWHALNLVLWAGCTFVLARSALSAGRWQALVVAALSTCFLPLLQGLVIGQVHVIVLAACLSASLLVQRDRQYSARAVLAFGAFIKYFPAFLLLYYLLRGRWRVIVGAAVARAALAVVQALIVGPQIFLEGFGNSVHFVQGQAHGAWVSAIPGGIFWAALALAGFVGGMLWAHRAGDGDERLGVGWALCTMLLISPLVWWFFLTWLLPAFAACLGVLRVPRRRLLEWRSWGLGALLGLACALVFVRMVSQRYADAAGVVATLVLWGLCGALYLRSAGIALLPRRAPRYQLGQLAAAQPAADTIR